MDGIGCVVQELVGRRRWGNGIEGWARMKQKQVKTIAGSELELSKSQSKECRDRDDARCER